jgi:hypothetical protein
MKNYIKNCLKIRGLSMLKTLPFDKWGNKVLLAMDKSDYSDLSFSDKAKFSSIFIRKAYEKLFLKEQWFIGYRKKVELDLENFTKNEFTFVRPPKSRFYADPFLIKIDDKNYIFFEDFIYSKNKGVISYIELDKRGRHSKPEIVLERDYHLSYPFLFTQDNKIFMIPETIGNKTIEVYEAVEFPKKWKLRETLFNNLIAADSTLILHNDKYWLFTSMPDLGDSLEDKLYLFYSDSLFGEWKSHPMNPIISDIMLARSAGNLFYLGEDLIRPSQEKSVRYGYALNFNKIEILSESDYKETNITKIKPEFIPKNLALHTYNYNENFEVIDGMKLIMKF